MGATAGPRETKQAKDRYVWLLNAAVRNQTLSLRGRRYVRET